MSENELKRIDKELHKISEKINFYAVNPENADVEKRKFFRSRSYNPQFVYDAYKEDLPQVRERLQVINPDRSILGKIFREARDIMINDTYMLETRGSTSFTEVGIKLWGKPDKKLVRKAEEILKRIKTKKRNSGKRIFTARKLITPLKFALFKYGLRNWKVREKNMIASAAVRVEEKALLIKKNERFSKKFVERLIVHEIGTHIIRAENGFKQPYKIFARGFPGYLMTEEGLAVVHEELHGCLEPFTLKVYAGRVIAVHKSLHGSFRSTYNYLRKHFTKDIAWRLTVRAKRGLSDTSLHGGCTKDIAYLKGYLAIKKFLKNGGKIEDLYYGKIGIDDIANVKKIKGIVDPKYLPTIRYLLFFIETMYEQLKNILFLDLPYFDRYPLKLVQDVNPLRIVRGPLRIIKNKFGGV